MLVALTASILFEVKVGAAEPVKSDTVTLIQFANVPLPEVIRNLARQAQINVVIDPKLNEPPFSRQLVSVRWEGVTAKDALLAILENYGLILKFPAN